MQILQLNKINCIKFLGDLGEMGTAAWQIQALLPHLVGIRKSRGRAPALRLRSNGALWLFEIRDSG